MCTLTHSEPSAPNRPSSLLSQNHQSIWSVFSLLHLALSCTNHPPLVLLGKLSAISVFSLPPKTFAKQFLGWCFHLHHILSYESYIKVHININVSWFVCHVWWFAGRSLVLLAAHMLSPRTTDPWMVHKSQVGLGCHLLHAHIILIQLIHNWHQAHHLSWVSLRNRKETL